MFYGMSSGDNYSSLTISYNIYPATEGELCYLKTIAGFQISMIWNIEHSSSKNLKLQN